MLPYITPLAVNVLRPVPPYCTAKSVVKTKLPIFTVLVELPTLIVLVPPVATLTVPVVTPVKTLTIPVVTSLDKLAVPPAVLAIFNVLPVNAPPTTAVVVADILVPKFTVPLDPILIVPVKLCQALTVPEVTSVL